MRWMILVLAFGIVLPGCAETRVRPVVKGNEKGVRFYRPKPYIKLASVAEKPDLVTITIEYLPDFSEEYTIRAMTGIGTNDTEIKLRENGTLESLHSNTDAKFADNVNAIANLVKSLPTAKPTGTSDEVAKPSSEAASVVIPAHRVPLGYYEAAVSRGPDGVKRLYGWRYVGFAPFANCPAEYCGVDCRDCNETLYGLVRIGDTMVFAALHELATRPEYISPSPKPNPSADNQDSAVNKFLPALNTELKKNSAGFTLKSTDCEVSRSDSTFVISLNVSNVMLSEVQIKQLTIAANSVAAQLLPGATAQIN